MAKIVKLIPALLIGVRIWICLRKRASNCVSKCICGGVTLMVISYARKLYQAVAMIPPSPVWDIDGVNVEVPEKSIRAMYPAVFTGNQGMENLRVECRLIMAPNTAKPCGSMNSTRDASSSIRSESDFSTALAREKRESISRLPMLYGKNNFIIYCIYNCCPGHQVAY